MTLIERLQAGSGADRELDAEICRMFFTDADGNTWFNNWEYTSSLDACLSLAERVLPGWKWSASNIGYDEGVLQEGKQRVTFHSVFDSGGGPYWSGFHPELPRAFLIALLRAKESQDGK